MSEYPWERPLGARPLREGEVEFRVWAPRAGSISLSLRDRDLDLHDAGYGVYEVVAPAHAGDDYWFVVDGRRLPDPCSRWQPHGLRGPSRVLGIGPPGARGHSSSGPRRPSSGAGGPFSSGQFAPTSLPDLVLYELHIGTFTAPGTFEAAIEHLGELAQLGVSAIEIMPVAEFPGARGWGYDGVYISAAQSSYGGPAGLAGLIDAAHEQGLAVVLDVVYNHVGASGSQALEAFGPYFTGKYETPWGRAINFDDEYCDPVREWVLQSAVGWVADFGVDGLRLDAVHAIFDSSAEHIVRAVARRVHAANPRALVIAESGLNDPRVMRHGREGYACDAAWADDFHHSLRTLLTDERDGYYSDAQFGTVAALAKAFHRPHVHDGGYSSFRARRFGAPADDVSPERFVVFSQNHDQVGNRAFGDRLPASVRPLAAFCTLLAPFVPLLFMGEEYGEPAPFQFFSDHIDDEIATATREGRRHEFAAFAQFEEQIPDPQALATFEASKLTRRRDPELERLYVELLRARAELPAGEVDVIEPDEQARTLKVRRGRFELLCNFGGRPARLSCAGDRVRIATQATPEVARVNGGYFELAPRCGALIELTPRPGVLGQDSPRPGAFGELTPRPGAVGE
ncbi:MAG: malto-oligosyltrehalose trehalohydrolase [Solirubrobacteraceae bacterium]